MVLDVPHPLVVTVTVPQDSAAAASPSDTGNRSASHCVPLTFGRYIHVRTSAKLSLLNGLGKYVSFAIHCMVKRKSHFAGV